MLLALSSKGFSRSISKHNVDIAICCDWIAACALFDGEVSGSDVVDILREKETYATQEFAWALVNDIFLAIRERKRVLGDGYRLRVQAGTRVVADGAWQDAALYAFCLILSLSKAYRAWA